MPQSWHRSHRSVVFAGLCVSVVVAIAVYAIVLRRVPATVSAAASDIHSDPDAIRNISSVPHLLFRSTSVKRGFGQIGLVPLEAIGSPAAFTDLHCERVHFAAGRGICLASERSATPSYRLELFDGDYRVNHTVPLGGMPSRARISPDGERAAMTYFVSGDSYAAAGLSTRTHIVDLQRPSEMTNLESFAVTREGVPFKSVDFNFWGVTFARERDTFYATLASGGAKYLIAGNAAARTARVLRDGVECPSLSPDNRRIAFKRLERGITMSWRIAVLDLDTGEEVVLSESRSVDDQVEWLDNDTIIYALPDTPLAGTTMNLWAVNADGKGAPRLLLADAESPAVIR